MIEKNDKSNNYNRKNKETKMQKKTMNNLSSNK